MGSLSPLVLPLWFVTCWVKGRLKIELEEILEKKSMLMDGCCHQQMHLENCNTQVWLGKQTFWVLMEASSSRSVLGR